MTFPTARLLPLCLAIMLQAAPAAAVKFERLARFSPASGKVSPLEVASGSALVRFKAGVSTSAALGVLEGSGFRVASTFSRFNWSVVSYPSTINVASALNLLSALPAVEWAEPNRVFRPKLAPSDPHVGSQYALSVVQAFGAWEYETGVSSRVTIAILDTGIDGSHPELSGKLVGTSRAFDPVAGTPSNNQPPTPACNHATRAAGVVAAASNNGVGVAGMSWGARLLSLKVFDDADCPDDCISGTCGTTENAIAAAIDDVIAKHNTATYGKIIVNMSLGDTGSCSAGLQSSVNAAVASGLLLFAAAGNEGAGFMDSPANCSGVYAVGATDSADALASFSNTDPAMATKGLTAPGVGVYTTDLGGGYAAASGTSFSSPMAAGLAALIWSARPSYTRVNVFDKMKDNVDDLGTTGPDSDFGYGRINAYKSICAAVSCSNASSVSGKKAIAYPNPFKPKIHNWIAFKLSSSMLGGETEVFIYTSEGELVKKLDGLAWDGRNEAGVMVASGVYLFRVKTGKDVAVGRFALLK